MKFVPQEREGTHLAEYKWIPDLDVADAPDAWHPHDLLCALLTDEDGELRGVLSIDVPQDGRRPGPEQRRILELYARQAERAVITALERGEIARDLAQERAVAEYRAQLVDVLSHEVQNPLTVILHNAELMLAEDHHDDLTMRGLEAIERGARRIQLMGADLLVLARVGNPVRPLAETVDLVAVARDACEMLAAEAQQRSVAVHLADSPRACRCWGTRRTSTRWSATWCPTPSSTPSREGTSAPGTPKRAAAGRAGGARGRGRGGGHRRGRAGPGVRGVLPLRRPTGARTHGHRPRSRDRRAGRRPPRRPGARRSVPDVGTRFRVLLPLVG